MKTFLIKTALLLLVPIFGYMTLYSILESSYIPEAKKENIYIWGDSQTLRGLNIDTLSKITNRKLYSMAKSGAGVYDFLIFSQKVPSNSTTIVGFSTLAFIRPKSKDRNNAGLSLRGIYLLLKNNYSKNEVSQIIYNNYLPKRTFDSTSHKHTRKRITIYKQKVSNFKKITARSKNYLFAKQEIYKEAIKILAKKKCRVILVQFPLHKRVDSLYKKSSAASNISELKQKIIKKLGAKKTGFQINTSTIAMYDLTHLNLEGANYTSIKIAKLTQSSSKNLFIEVKLQEEKYRLKDKKKGQL